MRAPARPRLLRYGEWDALEELVSESAGKTNKALVVPPLVIRHGGSGDGDGGGGGVGGRGGGGASRPKPTRP